MPTGLPTMTWNIINAQLMEVRGPTIMTVVGAITNGMDIRIIIGSIAQIAAKNVHGNVSSVDIKSHHARNGAQ